MKYFAVKFVCVVFVAAILIISTSISWTSSNNSTEEDSIKEVREVSEDEKQQVALESSEPITMDNEVLHDLEDQLFTQRCLTEEAVQALHKAQQKAKRETRDWKLWAQAKEKRHLKEVESLREGQLALENQKLAAEQVKAKERASKAEVAVLQLRTERNEEKERAARFEKDAKEKGRQVESLGKLLEDESMQANIVGVKYNEAEASLKYQNSVLKAKLDGAVETERQGRATIDTLRGKFQQQRVDMEDMYTINLQRATATLRSENEGLRQESLSKTAQIDQLTAEINRITVHARVNAENSVAEMAAEKVRNLEEQLRKQAGTITELEESLSELQYARQQAENRFAGAQDQLAQLQLAQLNRPVNQKARLKEVAKRLEKEKSEREEVRSWEVGRDAENVQLKFEVDQFKQEILRLPTENFNLESQNESLVTSVRAYEELHGGANAGEGKVKVSRRRDEDEDEEEAAKPRQLQRLEAKPAMAAPSTTPQQQKPKSVRPEPPHNQLKMKTANQSREVIELWFSLSNPEASMFPRMLRQWMMHKEIPDFSCIDAQLLCIQCRMTLVMNPPTLHNSGLLLFVHHLVELIKNPETQWTDNNPMSNKADFPQRKREFIATAEALLERALLVGGRVPQCSNAQYYHI